MKRNKTKHAVAYSIVSIILCVAMLAGTTFAWFTDSVTSGTNKIIAGNLDIEVSYKDGSTWKSIQDSESLFSSNLWEPGHTEFVTLKVENKGTLAFNYKLNVTPVNEKGGVNVDGDSFKLSDFLMFGTTTPDTTEPTYTRDTARALATTAKMNQAALTQVGSIEKDGDAQYITLVVFMPETVGNEANYLTGTTAPEIDLGITVIASQKTSEDDSFGDDYDDPATDVTIANFIYDYIPQIKSLAPINKTGDDITSGGENVDGSLIVKSKITIGEVTGEDNTKEFANIEIPEAVLDALSEGDHTIELGVEEAEEPAGFTVSDDKTVSTYDITLTDDGVKVETPTAGIEYKVELFIGKGKSNVKVYHKGVLMDSTKYSYNVTTGILTIYTDSFSPYTIEYDNAIAAVGATAYYSLKEAVAAVKDNDTLFLLRDVKLSEKLVISNGKTFAFDLGGNTITGRVNVDGAKVTFKNGTIDADSMSQALNAYGKADLAYKDTLYSYIKVEKDVVLKGYYTLCVLKDMNVYTNTSYGVKIDFYGKAYGTASVSGVIGNDVPNEYTSILPEGYTAPSRAMADFGPVINIYGTLDGGTEPAFYLAGMATINVKDGATVIGSEGFSMKNGIVNVEGGTVASTGAKADPVQAVDSGNEASGAAISVTTYYTWDTYADRASMKVTISGGKIVGGNNAALLVTHSYKSGQPVLAKQGIVLDITGGEFSSGEGIDNIFIDDKLDGDCDGYPTTFITGGTFTTDPSEFVVEGYFAKFENEKYTVMSYADAGIVASIGNVNYSKFQDAVDAVKTGETIILRGDITDFTGIEQILEKDFAVDSCGKWNVKSSSNDWVNSGFYIKDLATGFYYFNGGKQLVGTTAYAQTDLYIPEGVEDVAGAKRLGTSVVNVYLPSTIKNINNRAFYGMTSLKTISYKDGQSYKLGLPNDIEYLGDGAFQQCSSFDMDFVIPSSITAIGSNLFYESGLKSITVPEGVVSIGDNAFRGCKNLTEIVLPSTITTIGSQVCRDDANLLTIKFLFEEVPESFETFSFASVSAMFNNTADRTILVKNSDIADALWVKLDSTAKQHYTIRNIDNISVIYYPAPV